MRGGGNMGYIDIVKTVFLVLWCLLGLMLVHYAVFTVIGIFKKKKYPKTNEKLKYAVIISARNEESVIGDLLDSIKKNRYPQDKITVFVAAHNCTDATAAKAREKGAVVYEYDNPAERTVGYAYRYLVKKIDEDYGCGSFDGFFVINADNILSRNYISAMNDAFVATGKKDVITSYRNSVNFGANSIACLYGLFFISSCRYESRGRTAAGCSTRVSGTGYMFPSELLKDGWNYVTLTEDWEFTADNVSAGRKIIYCDDAEFFDEQPTDIKVMLRQRLRWARGHMVVFFTRFGQCVRSLFEKKAGADAGEKFSIYDISASIMPIGVMSLALTVAQIICVALCPLFGYDAVEVWTVFGAQFASGFLIGYVLALITGTLLLVLERGRIPYVKRGTMFAALLLYPFFIALNIILDVLSLFTKNLKWKEIPHGNASRTAEIGA